MAPTKANVNNLISLLAIILLVIFVFSNFQISIVDDAYIFERYARNFVLHGQLVFNLGEKVEGITSFLWTMIIAFNEKFIQLSFEKYITVISLIITSIFGCRLWYFYKNIQKPWLGFISLVLLFAHPNFLISSTNGLEGVLYGYLLFEMVFAFWEGKTVKSFILGGLVFLTRPEGFIFAPIIFIILFITEQKKVTLSLKFSLFLLIVISITIFRSIYYGQILPNSVMAKSIPTQFFLDYGLSNSLKYILGFIRSNVFFIFILFLSLLYFLLELSKSGNGRSKKGGLLIDIKENLLINQDNRTIFLGILIILYSFVVTLRNGGDWMPGFRLLSQYLPVYVILLFLLAKKNEIGGRIIASYGIALGLTFSSFIPNLRIGFPIVNFGSYYYEDISRRVEYILEEDDLISAEAIGYISHILPEQPIFDPLGLTNEYIAKYGQPNLTYGKSDIQYLLTNVKPVIIIWHWGGHLQGYEKLAEEGYTVFCQNDCDNFDADLVLIRKDAIDRFKDSFADWKIVLNLADTLK